MPVAEDVKTARYGPIVAVVNSRSEPGTKYEVRRTADGTFGCQCMAFRFNKDRPKHCKHTDGFQGKRAVVAMTPTAVAAAHAAGPGAEIAAEALRVAKDVVQYADGKLQTAIYEGVAKKIEAAIRKFMGALPPAPMLAPEPVMSGGYRLITLDE